MGIFKDQIAIPLCAAAVVVASGWMASMDGPKASTLPDGAFYMVRFADGKLDAVAAFESPVACWEATLEPADKLWRTCIAVEETGEMEMAETVLKENGFVVQPPIGGKYP